MAHGPKFIFLINVDFVFVELRKFSSFFFPRRYPSKCVYKDIILLFLIQFLFYFIILKVLTYNISLPQTYLKRKFISKLKNDGSK